jgi:hypothetical protein
MSTTTLDACDELRASLATTTRAASSAVGSVIQAQRALPAAGDNIIAVYRATIDLILACEAAETAFADAVAGARAALAASMESCGAGTIQTATHSAALKAGARRVMITGTVPPEMLKTPEPPKPRPDLDLIKAALKNGPLEYAHLSNGGEQVLAITSRKQS